MAQTVLPVNPERLTFEQVGQRYLQHLEEVMQRKRTTIHDYRIMLRRHLGPHFGSQAVAKLAPRDVDAYIAAKRRSGLSVKTIINHLNFAHGVLAFALKRGWVTINAVAMTDRPPSPPADPDIRFLDREELEALFRVAATISSAPPTARCGWPRP
jgi:site-specific recombinase XerC